MIIKYKNLLHDERCMSLKQSTNNKFIYKWTGFHRKQGYRAKWHWAAIKHVLVLFTVMLVTECPWAQCNTYWILIIISFVWPSLTFEPHTFFITCRKTVKILRTTATKCDTVFYCYLHGSLIATHSLA